MKKLLKAEGYNVGKNIAQLRRARSLTQEQMAIEMQKLGLTMTRSHYSMIENNRKNLPLPVLAALVVLLGCSYNDIFKGIEADLRKEYEE